MKEAPTAMDASLEDCVVPKILSKHCDVSVSVCVCVVCVLEFSFFSMKERFVLDASFRTKEIGCEVWLGRGLFW